MWHCDVLPGLLWAPGSTWWCCQVAWSTVPPGLLQCSSSNLVVAPSETWPFDAMLTWKMPWKMLINLEWGTRHILWAWRWTSSYIMGIQPPTGHSSASAWVFMFPLGISVVFFCRAPGMTLSATREKLEGLRALNLDRLRIWEIGTSKFVLFVNHEFLHF